MSTAAPWYQLDPDEISLTYANTILLDPDAKTTFPNQYNDLLHSIRQRVDSLAEQAEENNRLAFVQPSYEQTLKLNAWIWGFDYLIDFDANRIGKTAGAQLNAGLWIFPNDPTYNLFKPHTDHLNRTYQTLQRPPISAIRPIRNFIQKHNLHFNPLKQYNDEENLASYNLIAKFLNKNIHTFKPNPKKRTIWMGGPSHDWNEQILIPEFVKWAPKDYIKVNLYEGRITCTYEDTKSRNHTITVIFKSYDQDDNVWTGAAVDGICLSEGFTPKIFSEVKQRFKYPAFGSWDYTPFEPRNTASKSALAHKVYKDPTLLPLSPYVFSGFGIQDTPTYILSDDKKQDLIKAWKNDPQGQARLYGHFYSSSPIVLKNYTPEIHALPLSFEELKKKWPNKPLLLFRGVDPGWSHVTACAWMALAPDNNRYIYRFYSESQRSIEERCEDIIFHSQNRRIRHPKSPTMWQEHTEDPLNQIKITWMDYHSFKTDENTKRPFAYNYITNGLSVRPSITFGPKERATLFNSLLLPQKHLPHPTTNKPPGSKIYFLINEPGVAAAVEKMANLFWLTFERGEKLGLTKDTVQDFDDDELDAASYVLLPIMNYHSFFSSVDKNNTGHTTGERLSYANVIQSPNYSL